jgi:L-ribulose-5-phosphate 3-epimerase
MDRRRFLARAAGALVALGFVRREGHALRPRLNPPRPAYRISLAQWSLHRTLRASELDPLDFPVFTRERFGLDAVEYVNTFFADRARDHMYLDELRRRADGAGVRSLLIMVDGEGRLGDPDPDARARAVERHHPWVDAAFRLGCHSIRVNASSEGTREQAEALAADGLARLTDYAAAAGLNVIVENHGGLSSDGAWLAGVIRRVDHPRCGTLPDFGNFTLADGSRYDAYRGVAELMPYARAVSAKSYDFDAEGNETSIDYRRMMKIVVDAGYDGYVGIEYEGDRLPEVEGIRATRDLLETVRRELEAGVEPTAPEPERPDS